MEAESLGYSIGYMVGGLFAIAVLTWTDITLLWAVLAVIGGGLASFLAG